MLLCACMRARMYEHYFARNFDGLRRFKFYGSSVRSSAEASAKLFSSAAEHAHTRVSFSFDPASTTTRFCPLEAGQPHWSLGYPVAACAYTAVSSRDNQGAPLYLFRPRDRSGTGRCVEFLQAQALDLSLEPFNERASHRIWYVLAKSRTTLILFPSRFAEGFMCCASLLLRERDLGDGWLTENEAS